MTSTFKSYSSKKRELSVPSLGSLLSAFLICRICCSKNLRTINNKSAEQHCVCRNLCGESSSGHGGSCVGALRQIDLPAACLQIGRKRIEHA
jgi:hypothetical protein